MMDESQLEVKNIVAVKDEETDDTTFKHDWQKLIEEKQSIGNSCHPYENEVKKPDLPFVFDPDNSKPSMFRTRDIKISSPAEEGFAHFTLPSPLYFKPFIRKKVRQSEIVFNRECKKVEIVWTNRRLPVDKETVCSAASKDAFDLKDLSESLPSTSTFENKPSIVEIESPSSAKWLERFRRRRASMEWIHNHNSPRFNHPGIFTHSSKAAVNELSETIPSACNSQMETAHNGRLMSLVMAQSWNRIKRHMLSYKKNFHPLSCSEKPDCGEQKEASKDSSCSRLENIFSQAYQDFGPEIPSSPSEQPTFGEGFAKMTIDDKQDEKKKETQDCDVEKHLPSPVLNPLPTMTPYVSNLETAFSWDSNKHWNTKFDWVPKKVAHTEQEFHCHKSNQELPDFPTPVPLNSPSKTEENANKKDQSFCMELTELRLNALKSMREQNRLKTLNSFRGVFSGDEDSSDSEEPSLEKVTRIRKIIYQKSIKIDSTTQTENLDQLRERLKERRQFFRELKESLKSFRTIYNPLGCRRTYIKSEKVVPD